VVPAGVVVAGRTTTDVVEAEVTLVLVAATSVPDRNCCTTEFVCAHCPCSTRENWDAFDWRKHCDATSAQETRAVVPAG
jgi:hypothetical protein